MNVVTQFDRYNKYVFKCREETETVSCLLRCKCRKKGVPRKRKGETKRTENRKETDNSKRKRLLVYKNTRKEGKGTRGNWTIAQQNAKQQ